MSRPWELVANKTVNRGNPNGQQVFDRTISIRRLKTLAGATDASVGQVGYSGAEADIALANDSNALGEIVLYTGIPAVINCKSAGRTRSGTLPADVVERPVWVIQLPEDAIPQYAVRDRDIIQDDESYRYEIAAADQSALGYHLFCVRLEA